MYSEKTMIRLSSIVDSLNGTFKTCNFNRDLYAKAQTFADYFVLKGSNAEKLRDAIDSGMNIEKIKETFLNVGWEEADLVVKFQYKTYDERLQTLFFNAGTGNELSLTIDYNTPVKGKLIYRYSNKTEYSDQSIRGYYFPQEFKQPKFASKYSQYIEYADCLIDTSTSLFTINESQKYNQSDNLQDAKIFISYVNQKTKKPTYTFENSNEENWKLFEQEIDTWKARRDQLLFNIMNKDSTFKRYLNSAISEAHKYANSDDELEYYIAKYSSKKTALQLKRSRVVYGSCSEDNSPRIHAKNIALLSAETANWSTFLKAHLDILNDNFDRISDGSYAWERRETYIKELESLPINLIDMLFGISLQIENAAPNHYTTNIRRLGRAIVESSQISSIEKQLILAITDDELDYFNRIVLFNLYISYYYHLKDSKAQNEKLDLVKKILNSFPTKLSEQIKPEGI